MLIIESVYAACDLAWVVNAVLETAKFQISSILGFHLERAHPSADWRRPPPGDLVVRLAQSRGSSTSTRHLCPSASLVKSQITGSVMPLGQSARAEQLPLTRWPGEVLLPRQPGHRGECEVSRGQKGV